MTKQKQAFTLVELIVVITILAILWTIAFISLQWYSKDARDSIRISDASSMKTSLELFHLNAGKYPIPDDEWIFTYSWNTLFYQWYFWNNVVQSVSRNMSEVPTDPLTGKRYIYSVSNTRNELEILYLLEWDWLALNTIWQTNAAVTEVTPIITWNYNWLFVKTTTHIVPLPSIINTEIDENTITEITQSKLESMVINRGENIPNNWSIVSNTWTLTWLVLTWTTIPAIGANNATKVAVIEVIKAAYIWDSALNNDWIINYVLNSAWESVLAWLFDTLVLNTVTTTEIATSVFTCWDTISVWLETYTTELISWGWWYEECWTSQNMRHWTMLPDWATIPSDTNTIEKWCYDNSSAICTSDWWLYTWSESMWFDASCNTTSCTQVEDTAKSVCWQLWEWWKLPTDSQWTDLTNAWATWWTWNQLSWIISLLPGYRHTNTTYINRTANMKVLSSTEVSATNISYRALGNYISVYVDNLEKTYGFSVVCIKN